MNKILLIALLTACASHKPKTVDNKKTIEKDYVVKDASSRYRPTWIEDASFWAKENEQDTENMSYFSFETSEKPDRELACDYAKASVKADIASQIKSKIEKSLDSYRSDGTTALNQGGFIRSYMDRGLKEKIAQNLVGVKTDRTYWERRAFDKELGATRNFTGFTCAAMGVIQKKNLSAAIDKAFHGLYEQKMTPEQRATLDKAIKQAK